MSRDRSRLSYNQNIEKTMNNMFELVNSTQNINDDQMYKLVYNTLSKYSEVLKKYYINTLQINDFLEQYVEISYKLINKYNKTNNEKIQTINKFINMYVNDNLDYKYYIFKEFLDVGIIEERKHKEQYKINNFKKVLQVLSSIYKESNNNSPEVTFEKSKVNEIQQKAKKIVTYIIELNKKSNLENQVELIKPTTTAMEITFSLPDIIIDNEEDFKKLVSNLYKLFWDNSQKIRGYALNNELSFINDLRTYYYHDIDHGDAKTIRKKYRRVKALYKDSCGKTNPETARDWQKVQEHIYDRLISFLEEIKITEESTVAS